MKQVVFNYSHRGEAGRLATAIAGLLLACSSSQVFAVDLSKYGIRDDIARMAQCVVTKLPSSASSNVAHMYWHPVTVFNGKCTRLKEALPAGDQHVARTSFLSSLSSCTGSPVKSDTSDWVLQVGDATAILAASGIRNSITGVALLEQLNAGAHRCMPQTK